MEKKHSFEDVSPIKNDDFPTSHISFQDSDFTQNL